jgi:hypothetical protein
MKESDHSLKELLYAEAAQISSLLQTEPGTLAVILSGPLALGKASNTTKLYFGVITDRNGGAIEHHFLDEGWGDVKRPVEIGRFPLVVARYLVEHGYNDMVSFKSLEVFRCGKVLWEKDAIGTEIINGAMRHIPSGTFVGESLHGAVSALDDAVSLLKNEDYANAVLVAREAATKAVGMVVGDRVKEGQVSFLEAAQELLSPEQYELFKQVMDIEDADPGQADRHTRLATEFTDHTLRQIGVDPARVTGTAGKER